MRSPLETFQHALGHAVRGDVLDGPERAALGPILGLPGLRLTAAVRRSWCEGRSVRTARLTLSALPVSARRTLVAEWVSAGGGTASFVHGEAEAFLGFLERRLPDPSHAAALCRFEQAVNRAMLAGETFRAPSPEGIRPLTVLWRCPAAAIVFLLACPDALSASLDGRAPLPPLGDARYPLLVAPGLPGWSRDATTEEVGLWARAETGVRAGEALRTAHVMVRAGALVPRHH